MIRVLPALMVAALAAAPALAIGKDSGPYYRAELAQPAPKSQVETPW